jgi:hypothetical protein
MKYTDSESYLGYEDRIGAGVASWRFARDHKTAFYYAYIHTEENWQGWFQPDMKGVMDDFGNLVRVH